MQWKSSPSLRKVISFAGMESHPTWMHLLHSPEAWIALVVGGVEILIHEPSVRFAVILMLALGIAFAAIFRKMRKGPNSDFVSLHLIAPPRGPAPQIPLRGRRVVIPKS
jgi:hypothetical protein